ncbi:MAG: hypothetical protein IPL40_12070 [Proteobacteria bacterium]|nr:hypothetical protein [Pseudomonadota bacterium]
MAGLRSRTQAVLNQLARRLSPAGGSGAVLQSDLGRLAAAARGAELDPGGLIPTFGSKLP